MRSFHCAEPQLGYNIGSKTDASRFHARISFHWWWLSNTEQLLAELAPQLSCDHVTPAAPLSVGPRGWRFRNVREGDGPYRRLARSHSAAVLWRFIWKTGPKATN